MSKILSSMLLSVVLSWISKTETITSLFPYLRIVKVWEDIEVLCYSSYEIESMDRAVWYKQTDGEAPQLIDTRSCKWSSCRFSSEAVKGAFKLKIRDVQRNDSGSYYCSEQYSYVLWNASTLLVGESSTDQTSLQLFVPRVHLDSVESFPLVCLVRGVTYNMVPVFWNVSGQVMAGTSDEGTSQPDGTYTVRSQILISKDTWIKGAMCTCIVQVSQENTMEKSVSYLEQRRNDNYYLLIIIGIIALVLLIVLLLLIFAPLCKRNLTEVAKVGRNKCDNQKMETKVGNYEHRGESMHRHKRPNMAEDQKRVIYASLDFPTTHKPHRERLQ